MGKQKPIERLVGDIKENDLIMLHLENGTYYVGIPKGFIDHGVISMWGVSSDRSCGHGGVIKYYTKYNLIEGSSKLKVTKYEILRRSKK